MLRSLMNQSWETIHVIVPNRPREAVLARMRRFGLRDTTIFDGEDE